MRTALLLIMLTTNAIAGDLPDPDKTPGAVNKVLTMDVICHKGWSTKSVRNVPAHEKAQVYSSYDMDKTKPPCPCEVDHLISLEIGGSNDIKNLWPQSYQGRWNAHVKDKLENRLHKEVCDGTTSLEDAQHDIATDWIAAYKARFKK